MENIANKKPKNILKKIALSILGVLLIIVMTFFTLDFYVVNNGKKRIITVEEAQKLENVDCILVLGASVRYNYPSKMLEDRLLQGISLYIKGVSPKMLMSGDHGNDDYDEVNIMKNYAVEKGIPSEKIFMDHAGFSTYESIYRAKEVFKVKKMVIVTQEYHLYRALYIAKKLGIEAYGVPADKREYSGQSYRDLREKVARNKDFWQVIFKPEPRYLGDSIPVSGNGNSTND